MVLLAISLLFDDKFKKIPMLSLPPSVLMVFLKILFPVDSRRAIPSFRSADPPVVTVLFSIVLLLAELSK